ncbi:glutathione S-transferase family protein [Halocynthiibacter styelae]|uniref:Glutathione S-transferase family protein n=1 Tax=Halocynthiibacter styelae TaxID=2761955 RepID=A0A8J7IXD1_9RHOB|nr:glutathione S-transferase family protein [Paenihalocynthiibacter styelae]
MQLYFAPGTIAGASVLALLESGLQAEFLPVNFGAAEQQSESYLKINPKGRVPALITDFGVLTETGAILEYIARLAPDAGLIPDAPEAAARMHEMMYYLASTMHVSHAHKLRGHRWADQETSHQDMTAKVPETMAASCAWVEDQLVAEFVSGDRLSLADLYLFTICTWLNGDGVDITNYPKLNAHFTRMIGRDSVQTALKQGLLPEITT